MIWVLLYLQKKRIRFEKLLPFGFVKSTNGYEFRETILDGAFEVRVHVAVDGEVSTYVIDTDLNEEYLAIHVAQAWEILLGKSEKLFLRCLNVWRQLALKLCHFSIHKPIVSHTICKRHMATCMTIPLKNILSFRLTVIRRIISGMR